MLSLDIDINGSDGHSIYTKTRAMKRTNEPSDVYIGNHVWIGKRVLCLKGTKISDGSVVGAGSLVTKAFSKPNIIIAGSPAKIIKEGIIWKR